MWELDPEWVWLRQPNPGSVIAYCKYYAHKYPDVQYSSPWNLGPLKRSKMPASINQYLSEAQASKEEGRMKRQNRWMMKRELIFQQFASAWQLPCWTPRRSFSLSGAFCLESEGMKDEWVRPKRGDSAWKVESNKSFWAASEWKRFSFPGLVCVFCVCLRGGGVCAHICLDCKP